MGDKRRSRKNREEDNDNKKDNGWREDMKKGIKMEEMRKGEGGKKGRKKMKMMTSWTHTHTHTYTHTHTHTHTHVT